MDDQFCVQCNRKIPTNLFGTIQGQEFKDGWRCPGCAKVTVEESRKKQVKKK